MIKKRWERERESKREMGGERERVRESSGGEHNQHAINALYTHRTQDTTQEVWSDDKICFANLNYMINMPRISAL